MHLCGLKFDLLFWHHSIATLWHHCRSTDERKLERLQERALRAIYCDRTGIYEALLEKARLPTLCNRMPQDMVIFMYKVKTNLVPSYISDLFSCDTKRCNLRNTDDFSLPRYNTVTYGRHSLRYMGPCIWSKLHKSIKMADSLTAFKIKSGPLTYQMLCRKITVKIASYVKLSFYHFYTVCT